MQESVWEIELADILKQMLEIDLEKFLLIQGRITLPTLVNNVRKACFILPNYFTNAGFVFSSFFFIPLFTFDCTSSQVVWDTKPRWFPLQRLDFVNVLCAVGRVCSRVQSCRLIHAICSG